jgi:hypothetical protein
MSRRFPSPWRVETIPGGFAVSDANCVRVAYIYARDDLVKHTDGGSHLSTDEARRIASAVAKLPELMGRTDR